MEIINIIYKYKEDKLIKLIKKNKLNIDLEELLVNSVNLGYDKLSNYLIDKGVSFEYQDYLGFDCYLIAIHRGNIDIIKKLMTKGLNLYKKYKYNNYNKDSYAISYVIDLETFKFFEEHKLPKKVFDKCLESIVNNTVDTHNIELLSYLIDNYNIDITKFVYKANKNYSVLEITEKHLDSMKKREKRKREMTFFIDEIFSAKKYSKEIKKAYKNLEEFQNEIEELNKYYLYVKEQFEKNGISPN